MVARAGFAQHYAEFLIPLTGLELASRPSRTRTPHNYGYDRSHSKLTLIVRELLTTGPKQFKDLYTTIAARYPEVYPVRGKIVNITGIGWLHQLNRDLREIATCEHGVWRLNQEPKARMRQKNVQDLNPVTSKTAIALESHATSHNMARNSTGNASQWRFSNAIRELLATKPRIFKEIYAEIADRYPEECPVRGNKVNLPSEEQALSNDELAAVPTVGGVSGKLLARYSREKLHEEVWSQPVQRVAKRYGVSDVALAKTCRKLKIPLPRRGYWAKKAAGKHVEPRPPLPSLR